MGTGPKLVSFIVAIAVAIASTALSAREYRSREVSREFQREHPCPSTGRTSGACPGYRKDHIEPLACGGPDEVWNLQQGLRPLTRAAPARRAPVQGTAYRGTSLIVVDRASGATIGSTQRAP